MVVLSDSAVVPVVTMVPATGGNVAVVVEVMAVIMIGAAVVSSAAAGMAQTDAAMESADRMLISRFIVIPPLM